MKYAKVINQQEYDVIVVGAGMSGLSCAANLSASGLSVLVLEQHFVPGGATTMFKRGAFVFEGGGHRVTGIRTPGAPLHELIKKIGKEHVIKAVPINPSYVVKVGDRVLEADVDIEKYKANLMKLFPDQELNIHRFIRDMLKMNQAFNYVASNKINPFVLITKHSLFIKYAKKTTGDFISYYFNDQEIIAFVTAVGNYTTLPISKQSFLNFVNMWSAHHLGEGMSLIEGGTIILVDALVDFIEQHNGQVVVSKDVDEIIIENHKAVGVKIKDGTQVRAKIIVSTASNQETYLNLIAPQFLKASFLNKVKNEVPSGALFQLFLGILEMDQSGIENVTTFILGSGKDEDHMKRIYNWDMNAITEGAVLTVEGSENAPDGMRSINLSCLCPYAHPENWFMKGHDKEAYNAFKEELSEKLIENMCSHIPDLRNRIVIKNTATPLTMFRYTRATNGGLQGSAHTVLQSGNKRGPLKSPIKQLYRAGQYVFPGAGIITVTMSGKLCAEMILEGMK